MNMGRGLDSFSKDVKEVEIILETKNQETNLVSLKKIFPNKNQPRKVFDQEELEGLAASIKEHRVLQPLILRKTQDGYQIVVGERHYWAAKSAGLDKVPVLIKDISDQQADAISLVEDLQGEDLNPMEEAQALKTTVGTHKSTQQDLANPTGKNRPSMTNLLRPLNLEEEVQDYLAQGDLTSSHGKLLLEIKDPKKQVTKARDIIKKGQTTLEIEENLEGRKPKSQEKKDISIRGVEEQLIRCLGIKVRLKTQDRAKKVQTGYYSNDGLERIMEQMMGEDHEGL